MNPSVKMSCSLQGTVDELPQFFARLEEWAEGLGASMALVSSFSLMLDELLTNVAMHAYQGRGGPVAVAIEFEAPAHLRAWLRDHGPAYDPTARKSADTGADIEERDIGGLGVHFVKQLADQFIYRREGDVNEVFVSRTLNSPAAAVKHMNDGGDA
ncbi:ATP-binding protein [Diaphorobacter caeni]|uniref:ATP-binding protein n=1 Tax=Diaphorobacter caeni TaxID=2784387 RepID=UPI00188DC70C|nr:ATP-binding protein [Diaphorobacter caeni]MBF5005614.1 ATP-binding protein [Diaphorobacter caeni]